MSRFGDKGCNNRFSQRSEGKSREARGAYGSNVGDTSQASQLKITSLCGFNLALTISILYNDLCACEYVTPRVFNSVSDLLWIPNYFRKRFNYKIV